MVDRRKRKNMSKNEFLDRMNKGNVVQEGRSDEEVPLSELLRLHTRLRALDPSNEKLEYANVVGSTLQFTLAFEDYENAAREAGSDARSDYFYDLRNEIDRLELI